MGSYFKRGEGRESRVERDAMRCLRVLWLGVRRVSGVLTEARRRGGQNVEF